MNILSIWGEWKQTDYLEWCMSTVGDKRTGTWGNPIVRMNTNRDNRIIRTSCSYQSKPNVHWYYHARSVLLEVQSIQLNKKGNERGNKSMLMLWLIFLSCFDRQSCRFPCRCIFYVLHAEKVGNFVSLIVHIWWGINCLYLYQTTDVTTWVLGK